MHPLEVNARASSAVRRLDPAAYAPPLVYSVGRILVYKLTPATRMPVATMSFGSRAVRQSQLTARFPCGPSCAHLRN